MQEEALRTRPQRRRFCRLALSAVALVAATARGEATSTSPGEPPDIRLFFEAASIDRRQAESALERLSAAWRDGYAPLIIDLARFFPSPRRTPAAERRPEAPGAAGSGTDDNPFARGAPFAAAPTGPPAAVASDPRRARVRERLLRFLEKQTGQRFGDDLGRWRHWLWARPYEPHPDYALFKAALYGHVDARMAEFFPPGAKERIRLDEVDWGGVAVNGIPPLDHPRTASAEAAGWLRDDHVVFGLALNGEARAYPKRILAWHELARDRVGGVELAIVYCTLCGTLLAYGAEVGGERRSFGTSGLLYRSNKLMFDEESKSLWSTAEGRPVLGPLAQADLELTSYPVVTTRWGEWRRRHPRTTVVSLDTGYERDYSEGAAYRDYFSTDRLMFGVPRTDDRLKNKDEVLALLLAPKDRPRDAPRRALALSVRFLQKNRLHALRFAGFDLLVVTSPAGANRVFVTGGQEFVRQRADGRLVDESGRSWQLTEDALVPDGDGDMTPLPRLPARRAFWFGWYAQFPDTELVR